jgi:hypothetical protein
VLTYLIICNAASYSKEEESAMIYNKEIEAKKNKEALLALMTMRA